MQEHVILIARTFPTFVIFPSHPKDHDVAVGTEHDQDVVECVEQHDLRRDAHRVGEGVVQFTVSGVEPHLKCTDIACEYVIFESPLFYQLIKINVFSSEMSLLKCIG